MKKKFVSIALVFTLSAGLSYSALDRLIVPQFKTANEENSINYTSITENKSNITYEKSNKEQAVDAENLQKASSSTEGYADNAILNLSQEQYNNQVDALYKKVDKKLIKKFDKMKDKEILESVDGFKDKYDLGEPFSEEDQALVLYACENASSTSSNDNIQNMAYVNRKYDISGSQKQHKVNVSFKGQLSVYVGAATSKYGTNVSVSASKKIDSLKWTTEHRAYGLLGMSGSTPSIGLVYSGNTTSGKHTNDDFFHYEEKEPYSAITPVYTSTWGKLKFNVKGDSYSMVTPTKSHFE